MWVYQQEHGVYHPSGAVLSGIWTYRTPFLYDGTQKFDLSALWGPQSDLNSKFSMQNVPFYHFVWANGVAEPNNFRVSANLVTTDHLRDSMAM